MEKSPDFIIWAYGQAIKLAAPIVPPPARVEQSNLINRPPSIPELVGLGFGRRKPRG